MLCAPCARLPFGSVNTGLPTWLRFVQIASLRLANLATPAPLAGIRPFSQKDAVRDKPYNVINYDGIASEYAQHRRVHPEVLGSLLLTSSVGRASKMLEVGCSTGNYIVALEALAGFSCWGIDPSEYLYRNSGRCCPGLENDQEQST